MGCPSITEIGDTTTLTFTVNTHDPETLIAMDADAVPTYRVYEDETATPIATGSMAKLDDANTTGFYSENLTISAANGYEHGKSYSVYIEAVMTGSTGTISYNFKAFDPLALASVCTEARLAQLDTTSGKLAYYAAKLAIALMNKVIITEADGTTEQFNDAGSSLGTIATAFTTDSTYTTRKRLVI